MPYPCRRGDEKSGFDYHFNMRNQKQIAFQEMEEAIKKQSRRK